MIMPTDSRGRQWQQVSGQGVLTVGHLADIVDDWIDEGLSPFTPVKVGVDGGFWQITAAYEPPPVDPDCRVGKHAACSGNAWDELADELTVCGCGCHKAGD